MDGWLKAKRSTGWPLLRYKDVYKRDMKATEIIVGKWKSLADDCIKLGLAVKTGCKRAKVERMRTWVQKNQRKKAFINNPFERDNLRLFTLPQALQLQNRSSQSRAKVPTPMIHCLQGKRRAYMFCVRICNQTALFTAFSF